MCVCVRACVRACVCVCKNIHVHFSHTVVIDTVMYMCIQEMWHIFWVSASYCIGITIRHAYMQLLSRPFHNMTPVVRVL